MKIKVIVLVAVLAVAAGAAVMYSNSKKKAQVKQTPKTETKPQTTKPETATPKVPKVEITAVEKDKLPERFPTDVPIEQGATITYNYNAINASGKFQASREFISKKSLAENYQLYKDALKKAGWTITYTKDDTAKSQMFILASKGDSELNIRVYSDNGQVKVSINNETQP